MARVVDGWHHKGVKELTEEPCPRCQRELPLSEFNLRSSQGRTPSPTADLAPTRPGEWYADARNGAHHRELVASRRRRRIRRHKEIVAEAKAVACADCGICYETAVMDFDHIGAKSLEVSKLLYTHSTERLLAEIEECEVVCSNCHRMRTQRPSTTRGQATSVESVYGLWRSLAARCVWDAEVVGSNPTSPPIA